MHAWVTGMAFILLAAACWTDLRHMIIPNGLTAGFAVTGLAFHAGFEGGSGAVAALAGGMAGMFPLLMLYRLKGIGAGDVKWFGAFGVWSGWFPALQLLIASLLFAGCLSCLLLLLRAPGIRKWGARLPWPWGRHPVMPGRGSSFPFMLAVAPGFAWMMWSMGWRIS